MLNTNFNSIVFPIVIILSCLIIFFLIYNIRRTTQRKCPNCDNRICTAIKTPFYLKVLLFYLNNFEYYKCHNCGNSFILVIKL